MISARKLPEMRTFAAPVRIAWRSEATAHAASATSSGTSSARQSRFEKTMKAPTASAIAFRAIANGAGLLADFATVKRSAASTNYLNRGRRSAQPCSTDVAEHLAKAKELAHDVDNASRKADQPAFLASKLNQT